MFAVIFTAEAGDQDTQYGKMVEVLRDAAFNKYGCLDFIAVTEEETEIAISYWPDEASIAKWKRDTEHLVAQKLGQSKWYKKYKVEVVEIKRSYTFTP